jgi:hypothetical protein
MLPFFVPRPYFPGLSRKIRGRFELHTVNTTESVSPKRIYPICCWNFTNPIASRVNGHSFVGMFGAFSPPRICLHRRSKTFATRAFFYPRSNTLQRHLSTGLCDRSMNNHHTRRLSCSSAHTYIYIDEKKMARVT